MGLVEGELVAGSPAHRGRSVEDGPVVDEMRFVGVAAVRSDLSERGFPVVAEQSLVDEATG